MPKYKVSVIVPFWNVEKFLPCFLDSLMNQTLQDIEIILVDDCSSDASYILAKKYQEKDYRITLLQNPYHSGSGALGRQIGMNAASGKYLVFWDADDFVDKDALQQLYDFSEEQNADIITFGYEYFQNQKKISMDKLKWAQQTASGQETLVNFYFAKDQTKPFCLGTLCNKFIRHTLVTSYQISHPDGAIRMQELLFSVQCIIHAQKVVYYPHTLYYWRLDNPFSITKSRNISLLITIFSTILTTLELIEKAGYMTTTISQSGYSLLWQSVQGIFTSSNLYTDSPFLYDYTVSAKAFLLTRDPIFFEKHSPAYPILKAWIKWLAVIEKKHTLGFLTRKYHFYFLIFKYKYIPFSYNDILYRLRKNK